MNQQNTFTEAAGISYRVISDIFHPMLFQTNPPAVIEVATVFELLTNNFEIAYRIFFRYLKLVKYMSELTEEDLDIIKKANALLVQDSASDYSAADFLSAISLEQKLGLRELAIESVTPGSSYYEKAIEELVDRMQRGSKMNAEGKVPKKSDKLIWDHTQLKNSYVLFQFIICHYFERYMSEVFKERGLPMASSKDWFINILKDVIALRIARKDNIPGFIKASWTIERINDGLGWLGEDRINAYKQILDAEEG